MKAERMTRKYDDTDKFLAKLMTVVCVRNTIIEDYHADGKISQKEMKAFNKEVCNKIYTWLYLSHQPRMVYKKFVETAAMFYPNDWDEPELDKDLMFSLKVK